MSITRLNKFQCSDIEEDKNCMMTTVERVYSITRIVPDPFLNNWRKQPAIQDKSCLMKKIRRQMQSCESFDFSVEIEDEIFNVMMLVLKCYSKFFLKLPTREKTIKLSTSQISSHSFIKIYEWMLSNIKEIKREDIIPLLKGAQYLKVELLEQQIWHLIQDGQKFQEDEAFLLYQDAKLWGCEKVQNMMIQRVQRFFLTIVSSQDFLLMEPDEVKNG